MLGTVFDIKEFALGDGDGIRTTVFLKGCPLRCIWCHNPEGLSPVPELYAKSVGCTGCGLCRRGCSHPECAPYGRCLHICPQDLLSVAGREWSSEELAERILRTKDTLTALGGGVTLSGGEPLLQSDFCVDILTRLRGKVHTAIETSGYASAEDFRRVAKLCDLVIMDIKLIDNDAHREYTGVSNERILANAEWLMGSGLRHIFRTPLIPGITDTDENLAAIAGFIGNSRIELLPYNALAPSKYKSVGREYTDRIDASLSRAPDISIFKNAVLKK